MMVKKTWRKRLTALMMTAKRYNHASPDILAALERKRSKDFGTRRFVICVGILELGKRRSQGRTHDDDFEGQFSSSGGAKAEMPETSSPFALKR
jgi:hypothetical protein